MGRCEHPVPVFFQGTYVILYIPGIGIVTVEISSQVIVVILFSTKSGKYLFGTLKRSFEVQQKWWSDFQGIDKIEP